jgi:hypothetical protein
MSYPAAITELRNDLPCWCCKTVGQEVRAHLNPYTNEVEVVICTDYAECDRNEEAAIRLDAMAEEYSAQQSFEAGQNPWAL